MYSKYRTHKPFLTLTKVLLLPKPNNTPESGLEPWFLFSVTYMLYLLSNPTTSMRVSHQCSVSLSQINIIPEHNPDTYYVSSVNLFAVAINVISIDRVNGDKDVGECNSFKNAIPCFHVLLKKVLNRICLPVLVLNFHLQADCPLLLQTCVV